MEKDNQNQHKLKMTFTPNTIEHLGVRMYSTLPPVIAELVANAYDADATKVHIHLKDDGNKEITVSDDGHGMSFSEINTKFLRIGRNRRNEEEQQESPGGRKVIGKKGLGKLSFFGIAHEIEVRTTKNQKRNSFLMKWSDILSNDNKEQQKDYSPEILENDESSDKEKGTEVILRNINRVSNFDSTLLANNLSKFFIIDTDFKIFVQRNDDERILIKNEDKYSKLVTQVEWNVPDDIELEETNYDKKNEVIGHLIATEKPIPPSTNMKGITLFSRKKLVNSPEYFSDSTSSHFFTYLTGWLEVDFIDDLGEDVISTNRRSLNWEHPEMVELREYLQKLLRWLETDWRAKRVKVRKKKLEKELKEKTGMKIDEWREHIPKSINDNLDPIINALTEDAELGNKKLASILKGLQEIIKPYPHFHWQNLHQTLHDSVFQYYKNEDYYTAVSQGVIQYIRKVQAKTGSSRTDRALLENTFSKGDPKLSVTSKFKRPDGTDFETQTITNITEGHRGLAIAMWQAFRCPVAHETVEDLKNSGLYSKQDCLDALGLLSHLFRRLDDSEIITNDTNNHT